MIVDNMVKEINERTRPAATYLGLPVFVRDDVPKNEVWFVQSGTENMLVPEILGVIKT